MNVLYLNTHDIGRYLQTYGYPVYTPNLLELSRDEALPGLRASSQCQNKTLQIYREILDDMRNRMYEWQKETADPLLVKKKVELPEGAICCTSDSYGLNEQVILPECREYLEKLRGV